MDVRVPVMVNHGVPVGARVWVLQQEIGQYRFPVYTCAPIVPAICPDGPGGLYRIGK
jgi:hypothetical protein